MKVAVQLGLLPGGSTPDKVKWAKDHGVQGIELSAYSLVDGLKKIADDINGELPICSVCGNATVDGERGFDFLDPDPVKRRASIDGSKALLGFCGEVGAVGQIVPPIFGPPVVPDLSPYADQFAIEEELMLAALKELGPFAAEKNTLFMLEPLNRYEQHYLRKQSDAVRVIKASGVGAGLGVLSDFFHMHIEETDSPQAFRDAKDYTTHIHLADNTRMEPGTGDIDFVASFKVLKENGFDGFMAYECAISGADANAKAENLAKSLEYVRSCIDKA
jgi:sugar phosphate isomerase/epimerase